MKMLMASERVTVKQSVNQNEFFPWDQQANVIEYCEQTGIAVQAYVLLTQDKKLDDPIGAVVAPKYQEMPARVVLRRVLP